MYRLIGLLLLWLFTPALAEPSLLLTSEPDTQVRTRHQTAVVGYQNGQEILQLDVELEVPRPTRLLRILPLPSEPTLSFNEERTSRVLAKMVRDGKFSDYPEQTETVAAFFAQSTSESAEPISEMSLRISGLEPIERLAEAHLSRSLSAPERRRIQHYLDKGYRNFYVDSWSLEGRVALPVRTFRFSSDDLYYPLSVHGKTDHLQLLLLTAWGRFNQELGKSFLQQLSKRYTAEEVMSVDRLQSNIRRRDLFFWDEGLYSMFPHSLSSDLVLASGPTSPTEDLSVSGEGQRKDYADLEGLGAGYLPLGAGNWWTYQVQSDSEKFEKKLAVSSHDRDSVGTVTVFLAEEYPESTRELIYTFHDGAASYDARYPAAGDSVIHFEPQVPLYIADGRFDYPPTGQSGGPVPGASRRYEGKAWNDGNDPRWYGETFQAVGFENVTVPAGTFRALRTEIYAQGVSPAAAPRVEWYADGVGLVKSVEGFGTSRVTTELTGYLVNR